MPKSSLLQETVEKSWSEVRYINASRTHCGQGNYPVQVVPRIARPNKKEEKDIGRKKNPTLKTSMFQILEIFKETAHQQK